MKDGIDPDFDGERAAGLNRRRVLRAIGGGTAGLLAFTGAASAHRSKFFGCSRVSTGTDGNLAVVKVGGEYEGRRIEQSGYRSDVPWHWESHWYEAADDEVIVGMLEEDVWIEETKHEDGQCRLCLNPNGCATAHYDSAADVVDALNQTDTAHACRGSVIVGDSCDASGTDGGNSGDGDESGDGSGKNVAKLTPEDGVTGERFGQSVAVTDAGGRIVVGAPKTGSLRDQPDQPGAVYVFDDDGDGWCQTATLAASDGFPADMFGWDVAVNESGDVALVGAPGGGTTDPEPGSTYLFEYDGNTWSERTKIVSSNRELYDMFGSAVALDDAGDTALVGAQSENARDTPAAGAAYAFEAGDGSWTQTGRLLLNTGDDDAVGASIDLDEAGDDGIVGAPGVGPNDYGFADIVSNGTNWTRGERFQPDSLDWLYRFGSDVAIDDTASVAVVGARRDQVDGVEDRGSAFVFAEDDGWSQQGRLTASDGGSGDEFGASVDVSADGDLALVGAPAALLQTTPRPGAAYTYAFDGSSWSVETELSPDDGEDRDEYGRAVALVDDCRTAVVGAPGNDDAATDAGAVYVRSL